MGKGIYNIDRAIRVPSNKHLLGQAKETIFLANRPSGTLLYFRHARSASINNITVQGIAGTPDPSNRSNHNYTVNGVLFHDCQDCTLYNSNIYDIGMNPINMFSAEHNTIADCHIRGAWNKGAGGRGYLQIQGDKNLIRNNRVEKLRHIVLQYSGSSSGRLWAKYNVLYRNFFLQDVNFHHGDGGYNLLQENIITIPDYKPEAWHCLMGPWSAQHRDPGPRNIAYKNNCLEVNNGFIRPFSDPNKTYVISGREPNPVVESDIVPEGGTLYRP